MGRLGLETNALLRKSLALQKKNWCSNCCLLSAPIIICIFLAAIQRLIDTQISDSPDTKCGCECLECELEDGTISGVRSGGGAPCPPTSDEYKKCLELSDDNCGVQYSTNGQIGFCELPNPSVLPPLSKIPSKVDRATRSYFQRKLPQLELPEFFGNGSLSVLYTGEDEDLTKEIASHMFPAPLSEDGAEEKTAWIEQALRLTDESIQTGVLRGELAGVLGAKLAGTRDLQFTLYVDPDLTGFSTLEDDDDEEAATVYLTNAECPANSTLLSVVLKELEAAPATVDPADYPYANALLTSLSQVPADQAVTIGGLLQVLGGGFSGQALNEEGDGGAAALDEGLSGLPKAEDCSQGLGEEVYGLCLLASALGEGKSLGLVQVANIYLAKCASAPPLPVPSKQVMEDALYCGWENARCALRERDEFMGAIDFGGTSDTRLDAVVQYNDTNQAGVEGGFGGPPLNQRIAGFVGEAVEAWGKVATNGGVVRLLGLQDFPVKEREINLDFSSLIGLLFYDWMFQFLLPVVLVALVYEKEVRLRLMMRLHGVTDVVYWSITYLYFILLHLLYVIITLLVGSAVDLNFFRKNGYGLQIVFYLLHSNLQIATAFLLSTGFTRTSTALVFSLLWVFGSGLVCSLILDIFLGRNRWFVPLLDLIPSFSLYHGLYELSQFSFLAVYTGDSGLQFSNLRAGGNGMWYVMIIMLVEALVFFLLTWYLNQVTDQGTGMKKHPLFFLKSRQPKSVAAAASAATAQTSQKDMATGQPQDVADERERVRQLAEAAEKGGGQLPSILLAGLQKVFPRIDGNPPKVAVRELSLAVDKGECFGLLGPNGAGKSTSINMMTGFLMPTKGSAVICGRDIRADMVEIYRLMGVCPQHDLLWQSLTAREHLMFYGRLKELRQQELTSAVDEALKAVNLYNGGVGDRPVKTYSGGMKRRLSVAISLIGDPKVVYLDEPSTGLDPASRRALWDVVQTAKQQRAIILTTHSMEEAAVLCDRLGIFVDGRMACLGAPRELTSVHGGYLVFSITVPTEQVALAKRATLQLTPEARLTYEIGGTLKYELPLETVSLGDVFQFMEGVQSRFRQGDGQGQLEVLDWGVHNASLEEVFIKFARKVGAETKEMAAKGGVQ